MLYSYLIGVGSGVVGIMLAGWYLMHTRSIQYRLERHMDMIDNLVLHSNDENFIRGLRERRNVMKIISKSLECERIDSDELVEKFKELESNRGVIIPMLKISDISGLRKDMYELDTAISAIIYSVNIRKN